MKSHLLPLALLCLTATTHAQERIISAGAGITELLMALNAQSQVVAVDSSSQYHVDKNMPIVGYHRQLSSEGLLALTPTLLIGSQDMGPKTTISTLKNSQVEVLTLPSAHSVRDLIEQVTTLSSTTQKTDEGKAVIADIHALKAQIAPTKQPSALFLMISESGKVLSAGKHTPVDTVMSLAGSRNLLAEKNIDNYKPISIEAIIEMNPDYLLIPERTLTKYGSKDAFLKQFAWLSAVDQKGEKILSVPSHAISGGFGLSSLKLAVKLNRVFSA